MNPFEAYAGKAKSIVERPAALIGVIKTRREARLAYNELVGRIRSCRRRSVLEQCLAEAEPQILQVHAEMPFFWHGDGEEFVGLEREIEAAFETVEAAQYFERSRALPGCEAGRLPGQ
jgi:hypothetical protein